MKIFNLLIVVILIGLFTGCTVNNNNIYTMEKNSQVGFTSKQIEEKIDWKYCEQETY